MPILYLCFIRNYSLEKQERRVGVLSATKVDLRVGSFTNVFGKRGDYILEKIEKYVESYLFEKIVENVGVNSVCGAHIFRNQCFVSVDNSVWEMGVVDGEKLVEYGELFIRE